MTMEFPSSTKVGMLGAGFILASHARSVRALPTCELWRIGDSSAGRAATAVREFGFAGALTSIEAMADSDCDSVHVLLPPTLHETAVEAMIAAGKSVFVEKPFVLSSAAALRLADLAEAKGVMLGVNHNFLFGAGYQDLRELIRGGGLGQVCDVAVEWHYPLPFIKHGPFDNWIVSGPANPLFEVGPHPLAFVLDLIGEFEIDHVDARDSVVLPSGVEMPRRWRVLGHKGSTSINISLALAAGHEARIVSVRGTGGNVRYDYGRDIGVLERTRSDNPMIDAYLVASTTGKALRGQSRTALARRIKASLRKTAGGGPFDESIARSIAAFYAPTGGATDSRHSPRFAAQTIRLAEQIAGTAGYPGPTDRPLAIAVPAAPRQSTVLVVGGTGFIGRSLVKRLTDAGHGVRVLSRSASSAALALRGLPVDIVAGSHGDESAVGKALDGIEIVYHLAKCEGRKWQDYVLGDVLPTTLLGRLAARANVSRFVYTGTIDSYDSASPGNTIDNTTPVDRRIAGRNLYARSKAACEAELQRLAATEGLKLVIARPGIVIGPGSPLAHPGIGRFAGDTEVRFWGDGTNTLPLVHVEDVADALFRAGTRPGLDGATLLVSGPPLMSAREYVSAYEQSAGVRVSAAPGSLVRFWLADFVKEAAKNLIRHPNRRRSTLHDWQCRSHRSRYDASATEAMLEWRPIATAAELKARAIDPLASDAAR